MRAGAGIIERCHWLWARRCCVVLRWDGPGHRTEGWGGLRGLRERKEGRGVAGVADSFLQTEGGSDCPPPPAAFCGRIMMKKKIAARGAAKGNIHPKCYYNYNYSGFVSHSPFPSHIQLLSTLRAFVRKKQSTYLHCLLYQEVWKVG